MSHSAGLWHRCKLVLHTVVFGTFLVSLGSWLTIYLVGTLGDPLAKHERLEAVDLQDFDSVVALTEKKVARYLGEWEFSEPHLPGHFHHIGRWYQADKWNFCIDCHGPIPHSRLPQVRAFLNMHNLFIACQVCHTPQRGENAGRRFGWTYLSTGELGPNPSMRSGVWGEYGAKIVPLEGPGDDPRPFVLSQEQAFAAEFRQRMNELSNAQKVLGNKFIHKRCDENPLRCRECHNPDEPYLPLADLGYVSERADFLVSVEVVDLVRRYEEFYLPNLLNPSERNGRGKKEGD